MINILVKLDVKDFNALHEFEKQASLIMSRYEGRLISAFETVKNSDGSGQEIHVLEFPNHVLFSNYRSDPSLAELAPLRESAILNTDVTVSLCLKDYG